MTMITFPCAADNEVFEHDTQYMDGWQQTSCLPAIHRGASPWDVAVRDAGFNLSANYPNGWHGLLVTIKLHAPSLPDEYRRDVEDNPKNVIFLAIFNTPEVIDGIVEQLVAAGVDEQKVPAS